VNNERDEQHQNRCKVENVKLKNREPAWIEAKCADEPLRTPENRSFV